MCVGCPDKVKVQPRVWNALGFWQYICGCIQYQDGYDLCPKHKPGGYTSLLEEYEMAAEEIKPKYNIRVHLADNTQDILVGFERVSAMARANLTVQAGIWVGDRLYPPSAIVYVELVEVK